MPIKLFIFLMLASLNFNVSAKIYKWVDENGVSHYSEKKPDAIEHKEIQLDSVRKNRIDAKNSIQLSHTDIVGLWLVDRDLFLPSDDGTTVSYGINTLVEFKEGLMTVVKGGNRLPSFRYELSGNSIDIGELSIEIFRVKQNSLKGEITGQEFELIKKK